MKYEVKKYGYFGDWFMEITDAETDNRKEYDTYGTTFYNAHISNNELKKGGTKYLTEAAMDTLINKLNQKDDVWGWFSNYKTPVPTLVAPVVTAKPKSKESESTSKAPYIIAGIAILAVAIWVFKK